MGFFSETAKCTSTLLPGAASTSSKRKRGDNGRSFLRPLLFFLFVAASFWSGRVFERRLQSSSSPSSLASSSASSPSSLASLGVVPTKSGSNEVYDIRVQTLSLKPRVFFLPGFADSGLAEALAAATEPKLSPSTLALRPGERAEEKIGIRTSRGAFVSARDDATGFIDAVERKLEALTGIPRSFGEPFNILSYKSGQRYETHADSFDRKEYGDDRHGQRIATLLVYLRTPPRSSSSDRDAAGGQTCFPLAEAEGEELERGVTDYRSCSGALKVPPTRPGDALLFYNLLPNSTVDRRSMHGGCELLSGTKWVATKWVRDTEFRL